MDYLSNVWEMFLYWTLGASAGSAFRGGEVTKEFLIFGLVISSITGAIITMLGA